MKLGCGCAARAAAVSHGPGLGHDHEQPRFTRRAAGRRHAGAGGLRLRQYRPGQPVSQGGSPGPGTLRGQRRALPPPATTRD